MEIYWMDLSDNMTNKYTDTQIANKIVEIGKAKDFICICLGMLGDISCDLDGHIATYANDMDALKRKAIHLLDEENANNSKKLDDF